jgi:hypothetical protein
VRVPWKLIGVAGLAGVAATGVVVTRKRRAHADLEPDELRARLHQRLDESAAAPVAPPDRIGEDGV